MNIKNRSSIDDLFFFIYMPILLKNISFAFRDYNVSNC